MLRTEANVGVGGEVNYQFGATSRLALELRDRADLPGEK
jgi:hypothetical protein